MIAGRNWLGWRRLGLIDDIDEGDADEPAYLLEVDLFRDVGELGLECLVSYPVLQSQYADKDSTGSQCMKTISTRYATCYAARTSLIDSSSWSNKLASPLGAVL